MKTIVLTGGGTAGHVTPNLALAPMLAEQGCALHYIGMKDSTEETLVSAHEGITFHTVRSGKLRRYFSWKNFSDPFLVVAGYFDASKIIKKLNPAVIFSKGGFVSVPVVLAGRMHKVPIVLHESDYTPGLANRIAINFADRVCVTFEDTLKHTKKKGVFTGTPIRPSLYGGDKQAALSALSFSGEKPIMLMIGGSSGAQAMNEQLRKNLYLLLEKYDIIHICGNGKADESLDGVQGYAQFEYVNEQLRDFYACCDFVVSRAGANAVFEFLALGIPSLLIPLPLSASRGDQLQNASYFERKGYSLVLFQEEIEKLCQSIDTLYEQKDEIMQNLKNAPNADGTNAVLKQILEALNDD